METKENEYFAVIFMIVKGNIGEWILCSYFRVTILFHLSVIISDFYVFIITDVWLKTKQSLLNKEPNGNKSISCSVIN